MSAHARRTRLRSESLRPLPITFHTQLSSWHGYCEPTLPPGLVSNADVRLTTVQSGSICPRLGTTYELIRSDLAAVPVSGPSRHFGSPNSMAT